MEKADELIKGIESGNRLSLARALSRIENREVGVEELVSKLYRMGVGCDVWGVTGPPGAGKSTLVDQMIKIFRKQGKTVAVIAVDPSSPFSGGAILGDRIRMQEHSGDKGVFIRSLGTRGKQGGLSQATREVIMAFDAARFDVVLVETAGVGQTELDVLKMVMGVLVILVPESGDSIQMMKAGLMEIADIFVVNKSDRPGADNVIRALKNMLQLSHRQDLWSVPVIKAESINGSGIDVVVKALASYRTQLADSAGMQLFRKKFVEGEILDIVQERVSSKTLQKISSQETEELIQRVIDKKQDPYSAADLILPIK